MGTYHLVCSVFLGEVNQATVSGANVDDAPGDIQTNKPKNPKDGSEAFDRVVGMTAMTERLGTTTAVGRPLEPDSPLRSNEKTYLKTIWCVYDAGMPDGLDRPHAHLTSSPGRNVNGSWKETCRDHPRRRTRGTNDTRDRGRLESFRVIHSGVVVSVWWVGVSRFGSRVLDSVLSFSCLWEYPFLLPSLASLFSSSRPCLSVSVGVSVSLSRTPLYNNTQSCRPLLLRVAIVVAVAMARVENAALLTRNPPPA
jgi:hypothetical protein